MQTAQWAARLPEIGHEVIVSAFYGLGGAPLNWRGITVLPGNFNGDHYGASVLPQHLERTKSDLILTLMDVWALDPAHLQGLPLACWMPSDCQPLGAPDRKFLQLTGAIPIAMSRAGEKRLRAAGFDPLYVPHSVDTSVFRPVPAAERDEVREVMGMTGKFLIGINANNKDSFRKGMWEQMAAFARLHKDHPDALLLVHGLIHEAGSVNLAAVAENLGITGAVKFAGQYEYLTGQITDAQMATWYAALDLYSQCSFGEGFGITALEAQACGVPVVVTDAGAMAGLCGGGWKVAGESFWNPVHNACWTRPSIPAIHRAYEQAYQRGKAYEARRARCVPFAAAYDADAVLTQYWKPALEAIQDRIRKEG